MGRFPAARLYHGNFLQAGIMPGTPVFPCFSRVFFIALDKNRTALSFFIFG
jgi:hypothetical protein